MRLSAQAGLATPPRESARVGAPRPRGGLAKRFAGGTSGHGIGHLSNEVTATFATRWVDRSLAMLGILLAGSNARKTAQVWVGLRRTDAPEVSWKDVQTPTGYQNL
jgi:hypothetical protein